MVRGLDLFQEWFADYVDQYVLIGDRKRPAELSQRDGK